MGPGQWTGIGYLDVHLLGGDGAGIFYGNGRHQIAITVSIKPVNHLGHVIPIERQKFIAATELIDYVTGVPLTTEPQSWFYSMQRNEYYDVTRVAVEDPVDAANGIVQLTFYVMCESAERQRSKSIAVRISPPHGDPVNSGLGSPLEHCLTLHALEEVHYTTANTAVTTVPLGTETVFTATNYYLGIDYVGNEFEHFIMKANLDIEYNKQSQFFFIYDNAFEYRRRFGRVWAMGPERTATIYDADATRQIKINQVPHNVCFTAHKTKSSTVSSSGAYVEPQKVEIFDQFGNAGRMHAIPSGNPADETYGHDIVVLDGRPS